jgi:hypothetical protein
MDAGVRKRVDDENQVMDCLSEMMLEEEIKKASPGSHILAAQGRD